MKKPTHNHCDAITRGIALLKSGLSEVFEARFKKALERDMLLMSEVKDMLRNIIENPTLPFCIPEDQPPDPDPVENVN